MTSTDLSRSTSVNQGSLAVMWCNKNWGDLLQPAPLSISLLGSLMSIASSTSDFSLISETDKTITFKYAKYPTSFKTCLQQMVGDGYTAFETASHEMTRINNASAQLPDAIHMAVMVILQSESPIEIEHMLPVELDSVLELTEICVEASQTCEKAFSGISALAMEILECMTYKDGTTEQAIRRNESCISIAQVQKEQDEKIVEAAKQASDLMEESFANAEDGFKAAVNSLPSGWAIVGMHAAENLTNAFIAPIKALFGMANVKSDFSQTGPAPLSGEELSDHGVVHAQQVLGLASNLKLLVSREPDGKLDWDKIHDSNKGSGASYIATGLERIKDSLDNTKPISLQLRNIVDKAVVIARNVSEMAGSIGDQDDSALDKHELEINGILQALQAIVTRCNLILQKIGNPATGAGTPQDILTTTSSAQAAVEMAKFRVDQTRANLEAARESYDKASAQLIEGQRAISKTIEEMAQLNLENATLNDIKPVLVEAVKSFTSLRAQFSKMTEFFRKVTSLINDVVRPQVSSLIGDLKAKSRIVQAGYSLQDRMRRTLCVKMMSLLDVIMLAEQISRTYLSVSDLYIMPAQREVGHMLQFHDDRSEEGKRQFRLKLNEARKAIKVKAQAASDEIMKRVTEDQQAFTDKINKRLEMTSSTAGQLPAICF